MIFEKIKCAKKSKVDEVTRYFVTNHNKSSLKYACTGFNETSGEISQNTLESEVHYYLIREGFRWVEESECFIGVNEKIYQDTKEIVSNALRKYASFVGSAGV